MYLLQWLVHDTVLAADLLKPILKVILVGIGNYDLKFNLSVVKHIYYGGGVRYHVSVTSTAAH